VHATLCDLMMDLLQNSIEADATTIDWIVRETVQEISFSIEDNGKGMSQETQRKAIDPFFTDGKKHVHRRVGLGLPFLIQTADAAEGRATIESEEGRGTVITFRAAAGHVDLPPFGDFALAATMMLSQMTEGNLRIVRETDLDSYDVSRTDLLETLGDLTDTQNLTLMKTYLHSQEENLRKAG
jgi:hypothetical protein